MIKYDILLKIGFLLLSSMILNANNIEKVSLQLQWKHQFEFAGFYAAIEKGYYKDEGLEVKLFEMDANKNSIDEVLFKNATYGTTYSDLIPSYMQGKPVVILANIFKHSPLVLIAQEEYQTLSSLSDKKIMADRAALYSSGISDMFLKQNISMKNIKQIDNRFVLDDFVNKRVDAKTAFITNEPYLLDKMNVKYKIFSPSNYGTEFYDVNIFTSLDEFKKHPERTNAFVRASIKGWEYALNNSSEIIDLILSKYNTQNKTREALEYEAEMTRNLILPYVYELGSVDRNIIEKMARQYALDNKLSYKHIDFNSFYTEGEKVSEQESDVHTKVFIVVCVLLLIALYKYNKVKLNTNKLKKNINIIDDNVLISYSDKRGNITDVSEALCKATGYEKHELIGKNHRVFRHPETPSELFEDLWLTLLDGRTFKGEIKNLKKDGTVHWIDATITPIFDKNGDIEGFSAIRRDITDEKLAQELAITDQLTKAYNRLHLENIFQSEIKRVERYGGTYSVILMDVDYFKAINDKHGHNIGDRTLVDIVKLLKNSIRDTDTLGRWGGEEFLIICAHTKLNEAETLAKKLREIVEQYDFKDVGEITCSFGVSEYSIDDTVSGDIIKRADDALYLSKNNGRNKVTIK